MELFISLRGFVAAVKNGTPEFQTKFWTYILSGNDNVHQLGYEYLIYEKQPFHTDLTYSDNVQHLMGAQILSMEKSPTFASNEHQSRVIIAYDDYPADELYYIHKEAAFTTKSALLARYSFNMNTDISYAKSTASTTVMDEQDTVSTNIQSPGIKEVPDTFHQIDLDKGTFMDTLSSSSEVGHVYSQESCDPEQELSCYNCGVIYLAKDRTHVCSNLYKDNSETEEEMGTGDYVSKWINTNAQYVQNPQLHGYEDVTAPRTREGRLIIKFYNIHDPDKIGCIAKIVHGPSSSPDPKPEHPKKSNKKARASEAKASKGVNSGRAKLEHGFVTPTKSSATPSPVAPRSSSKRAIANSPSPASKKRKTSSSGPVSTPVKVGKLSNTTPPPKFIFRSSEMSRRHGLRETVTRKRQFDEQ